MEQEGPVYNFVFRKIILYGKKNIFMTEKNVIFATAQTLAL